MAAGARQALRREARGVAGRLVPPRVHEAGGRAPAEVHQMGPHAFVREAVHGAASVAELEAIAMRVFRAFPAAPGRIAKAVAPLVDGRIWRELIERSFDPGDPEAHAAPMSAWSDLTPCEVTFARLAVEAPIRLASWIASGGLQATDLTFAAEQMGRASNAELVARALLPLLEHPKPYVREGALLGLGRHLTEDVRARLTRVAKEDPVPVLREIALDLLDEE